jgi:phospholipid transport system substrate-binding protein
MIYRMLHGVGNFAMALLISAVAHAQQGDLAPVVDRLHAAMLGVMKKSPAPGYRQRFDALAPAITETYDFPRMARTVVGRYWKDLDGSQRKSLIRVLHRFTIAKYASRIRAGSGESFRLIEVTPLDRKTTVVRTEFVADGEDPIALTYVLVNGRDGRRRIADVLLKGAFSELARLRSEYVSVIKRQGFDALIRAVEGKTARMAGGP